MDLSALQSNRFQAWFVCFACSVVCLGAHVSADTAVGTTDQWITASLSISMVLSLAGVGAYVSPLRVRWPRVEWHVSYSFFRAVRCPSL